MSIYIAGIGKTKAAEKWELGLIDIAVNASADALSDAGGQTPTAVIVANALGGALGDQRNLSVFVASALGLKNVDAYSVCNDEASGGVAIRLGMSLIQSGMHETVLVVGAEKTSDALPDELESTRATGLDAAIESTFGFSPTIASALGMQRYLNAYNLPKESFFHLAKIAHANGVSNKGAIFRWPLNEKAYLKSPIIATPLSVCDTAPPCDGAAAVVLSKHAGDNRVLINGSASVSIEQGIVNTIESLSLTAAHQSAATALEMAGMTLDDISLFELHDSSALLAVLSIESIGLAKPGEGLTLAQEGVFDKSGKCPLWSFGGHKSRGNAPGACGVYQVVEACENLEHRAGENQISGATSALVQCLGSFGAQAVTHVLEKVCK